MTVKTEAGRREDLAQIEQRLGVLLGEIAAARNRGPIEAFEARIVSNWTDHLFKELWGGMLLAPGLDSAKTTQVKAWGLPKLPPHSDESFQLTVPPMLSLQRGASVIAEGDPETTVDPVEIRRYVLDRKGILGRDSGRWRSIVEFDPDADVAPAISSGSNRKNALTALLREFLHALEVGAYGKRDPGHEVGAKRTVLEFLTELHANGWEHARDTTGVRVVRLEKHLYLARDQLARKAGSINRLADYIRRQAKGSINLVEASVSDYGPGILDGFISSFAGRRYGHLPRRELLDRLIHEQLSAKVGDPNAGLGIPYALEAASAMYGFVSLRTGEFWLTLDGSQGETRMTVETGDFAKVQGTHWQMLYPDVVGTGRSGRAPV